MNENFYLKYNKPSPIFNEFARDSVDGNSWESYSLPLGNGYFGVNIFGRTEIERIQISEPTLVNPWYLISGKEIRTGCPAAGVNSFAEILLNFNHKNITNYERLLSLNDACSYVSYDYENVHYQRKAFTSYVDNLFVLHLSSNKENMISFDISLFIPFLGDYTIEPNDGLGKKGKVNIVDNSFIIEGIMEYYGTEYKGILKVINIGGDIYSINNKIYVKNANEVLLLFTCKTNYELNESIFLENNPKNKLLNKLFDEELYKIIDNATRYSFDELYNRHIEDYQQLFNRVRINIDCKEDYLKYTDDLIKNYKNGINSPYLEMLLFQYGRYLLISSSRTRLPAHLQGIWNCYCNSPWSCGYWHNINIQMNYWASNSTNLSELFIPYINYTKSYMKKAKEFADNYVKSNYPHNYSGEYQNGWIIGTGCSAYHIEEFDRVNHSGPGTGAFTALLFWDYYDYTKDIKFLREFGYQVLYDMSIFYTKILVKIDNKYLVRESASPENEHNGEYYHTIGCAFDQQTVYEVFKRTIESANILGISDKLIENIKEILPNLDPVLIGDDGQIKEYREETFYGSIGEYQHRHISQLVGLYPGTIINSNKKDWCEGAKITLINRGVFDAGWPIAYRLILWARLKDKNKCSELINYFIKHCIYDNLWSSYSPFQIDGNFGYTTAISEMLMQSHMDYIEILPCIPSSWEKGEFYGLIARGNFMVDCKWKDSNIYYLKITSRSGGVLKVKIPKNLSKDGLEYIYSKDTNINEYIVFENK